jgi:hypothetical protein
MEGLESGDVLVPALTTGSVSNVCDTKGQDSNIALWFASKFVLKNCRDANPAS